MLRSSFLTIFILILIGSSLAQETAPGWIQYLSRQQQFTEEQYYVGFVTKYFQKGEDIASISEEVKSLSRISLAESIYVSIKSIASSEMLNVNGSSVENYSQNSLSSSSLQATGLISESYVDTKKRIAYGIAHVKKKDLKIHYFKQLSAKMSEAKVGLQNANEHIDNEKAYADYMSIIDDLDEISTIRKMLINLGITSDVALMRNEWKTYYSVANEKAEGLRNSDDISMNTAAFFLADKLINDLNDRSILIKVSPITYKSSGISTEFSLQFHELMLQQLVSKGLNIIDGQGFSNARYALTGTYWPRKDKVQVSAKINEMDGNEPVKVVTSGSIYIGEDQISGEGIELEPEEVEQTIEKNALVMDKRVRNGGMGAEIYTQKGSQALAFKEGDILYLYIKVNRPSYIRLLNIMADNRMVLLLDNYYVDESKVNMPIILPFQWEAACPCGVEYIQMVAQSQAFAYIDVTQRDGFDYINGGLEAALSNTRGFKPTGSSENEYMAEASIVVTTLPR